MKKRICAIVLAISCVLICAFSFVACGGWAEKTADKLEDFEYSVDGNGDITITGLKDDYATKIVIPDGVKKIGKYAFVWFDRRIEEVIIGDSVTEIDDGVFSGCTNLRSITIGNGLTHISESAFHSSALQSITVKDGNSKYHSSGNCLIETQSKTLILGTNKSVIPNDGSVEVIGKHAFYGYDKLKKIVISDGVKRIESFAFCNCNGIMSSLTISNNVEQIEEHAFYKCNGLTEITVSSGNKKYHSNDNCLIETKSKTLILGCGTSVIPSDGSVEHIGDYAFEGFYTKSNIEIPAGITSIGDCAFADCELLTSIVIPNSVTKIGSYPFDGCSKLTSITFYGTYAEWGAIYGWGHDPKIDNCVQCVGD